MLKLNQEFLLLILLISALSRKGWENFRTKIKNAETINFELYILHYWSCSLCSLW
jgi:hypothetical protein